MTLGLATAAYKYLPIAFFIISALLRETKMKARIFGPTIEGSAGGIVLEHLIAHVHNQARKEGYSMLMCNMDAEDPMRASLPSSKFVTYFLQKDLRQDEAFAGEKGSWAIAPFAHENFADPRDF